MLSFFFSSIFGIYLGGIGGGGRCEYFEEFSIVGKLEGSEIRLCSEGENMFVIS